MSTTWGSTPAAPPDESIDAGDFFPAVSTAKFREDYRIPAELAPELIREHLSLAVIRVRAKLSLFRLRMVSSGVQSLAEAPQECGEKLELWRRAVSCEAKAEILRETVTVDRKEAAENAAKSAPETASEYRRLATQAIRLISGTRMATIEVI